MQHMAEDLVEHRYHGLGPNRREAPSAKVCRATPFERFEEKGFKAVIVVRIEAREPYILRGGIGSITLVKVSTSSIGRNSQVRVGII